MQKSANLSVYEAQLLLYLGKFHIPVDYQKRILEVQKDQEKAYTATLVHKKRVWNAN